MKIGIFDPYLDDNGGGERYMMTIAKCLSDENDVSVFWDKEEDLENVDKRFLLGLDKVKLEKNIFKYSFLDKQKVAKNFDLIIVLSDGSIPVLSSKKLLLHMQQPMKNKLSLKERLKLKRVDGIFCNSQFTKKFIEKKYKVHCDLLYPPVSIFGKPDKKENLIFHVGRFRVMNVKASDYKKQQVMVDTFKELVDKGLNNWRLLMAVSTNDVNEESFTRLTGSAKGYPVEFLINSTKDKLWEKGSKAKIYWHATGFGEDLYRNPHLAEHFGISTVEAMGVGAVPVVFNGGGQKEIVDDAVNGFLWEELNEFQEKTLKLVHNEKLLASMSEEAFKRSKDFNEQNFCQNLSEIIK